jgi:uncharacterized membrane protein YidH (DUF202 family)
MVQPHARPHTSRHTYTRLPTNMSRPPTSSFTVDLAKHRTLLANSRTWLAFIRTAFSLLAVAILTVTMIKPSKMWTKRRSNYLFWGLIGTAFLMLVVATVKYYIVYYYVKKESLQRSNMLYILYLITPVIGICLILLLVFMKLDVLRLSTT